MKHFQLFFILFLVSCVPTKEPSTTSGNINASAPYLWSDKSFPKPVRISSSFSTAEATNISDMSTAWKTALEDKRTFFSHDTTTPEITNSLSTMDSLLDSVMGVYKTTHWPPSLPGSALAVTQIFGRRYNVGSASEFVNIEHADILINYDMHSFDTADVGPHYDLRTVVLHEFGHFLGLQHKGPYTNHNDSVMYPSISSSSNKRVPRSIDISDMAVKYGITLDTPGAGAAMTSKTSLPEFKADPREAGEMVKILIELHADGDCVHRMDGDVFARHQVKLGE